MNGHVIPGTCIAVDFWQIKKHPGIKYFFLTHLHGDHIVGLTSSWRHPIYCSPLTAQLLSERYDIDPSLIRVLEIDSSHLIYPGLEHHGVFWPNTSLSPKLHHNEDRKKVTSDCGDAKEKMKTFESFSVTVINANHCPGAVMFLFEGYFGKVLYTGDFRYKPDMVNEGSLLADHLEKIDVLYLDNTYCSPECMFPGRHEALEEIICIAQKHKDCDILIGLRGLGKEELVAAVAVALKERVCVPPNMMSVMTTLKFPDVFVTARPEQRIRVVPFHSISAKSMRAYNQVKRTIAILPSAIFSGINGIPFSNQRDVYIVPYSDHSSFPELVQFVSKVKPASIVPIVGKTSRGPFGVSVANRADMSCFKKFLSKHLQKFQRHEYPTIDSYVVQMRLNFEKFQSSFPTHNNSSRKRKLKNKHSSLKKRKIMMGVHYASDDEATTNTETKEFAKTHKHEHSFSNWAGKTVISLEDCEIIDNIGTSDKNTPKNINENKTNASSSQRQEHLSPYFKKVTGFECTNPKNKTSGTRSMISVITTKSMLFVNKCNASNNSKSDSGARAALPSLSSDKTVSINLQPAPVNTELDVLSCELSNGFSVQDQVNVDGNIYSSDTSKIMLCCKMQRTQCQLIQASISAGELLKLKPRVASLTDAELKKFMNVDSMLVTDPIIRRKLKKTKIH